MSAKTDSELPSPRPTPCKVWDLQRTLRKSVVVSSLEELVVKGKVKLGIVEAESVRVVLESDGTEVEDEDYFSCLDCNMTFILLRENECWKPEGVPRGNEDEPDFVSHENTTDQLPHIVETIRGNPAKVIALSNEEMEVLVNADQELVASMLRVASRDAGRIQLNCQRYLDDRTKALDAIALLKSCDQPNKRQRTS